MNAAERDRRRLIALEDHGQSGKNALHAVTDVSSLEPASTLQRQFRWQMTVQRAGKGIKGWDGKTDDTRLGLSLHDWRIVGELWAVGSSSVRALCGGDEDESR